MFAGVVGQPNNDALWSCMKSKAEEELRGACGPENASEKTIADFCDKCGGTYAIQKLSHKYGFMIFKQYVCTKNGRDENDFTLSVDKTIKENADVVSNLLTEAVEEVLDNKNRGSVGPDINTTFKITGAEKDGVRMVKLEEKQQINVTQLAPMAHALDQCTVWKPCEGCVAGGDCYVITWIYHKSGKWNNILNKAVKKVERARSFGDVFHKESYRGVYIKQADGYQNVHRVQFRLSDSYRRNAAFG